MTKNEEGCGTLECSNIWKKGSKSGKFVTYLSHGERSKNVLTQNPVLFLRVWVQLPSLAPAKF